MNENIPSWAGVAASVGLVVICLAVIVREQLGLAREVAISAVRAAVQLVAVGVVLGWLFDNAGLPGAFLWVTLMLLVGASVAGRRGRGVPGARFVAFVALAVGVGATLGLLVAAQVIDTHPRVIVPVGGMVVSAATRGASVVLLRLGEEAVASRSAVEARLSLGLSASEAFAPHRRQAQRTALVTDVDAVKTVGLISLPGAMTGLLLAGVDPLTAIRYQVVVMYMILSAVAVAGAVGAQLGSRRLFDDADRLVV